MGGSSLKRIFFWQKKKKNSPLNRAWKHLRRALPNKKHKKKKKSILPLDKVNLNNLRKKQHSQKRSSLTTDKKELLKRLSLGNRRKESIQAEPKDGGGLGKIGVQIKKKFSQESAEVVPPSVSLEETEEEKEETSGKTARRVSKKKLSDVIKSLCPGGSKAGRQLN
ncbi:hypothetical protein Q5P01_025551 [Channa striata]|uniref:Uncharacterized protein n=1 Tax=Channa striata TaxID=64152 RepID=A0AA88IML2_CHASR|nr:hypothetical protein Q5P01_025551 [Channa striata]